MIVTRGFVACVMDSQPLFNMDHFEDNELLYALVETSEQDTTKEPEILGTGKKVFKKQCDSKEGETLHEPSECMGQRPDLDIITPEEQADACEYI
ncbi:UNVERIFIED_CONTAM: hypothetical protein FKN15_073578 [Acipenser sinensis]